jgi:hypothetical protein
MGSMESTSIEVTENAITFEVDPSKKPEEGSLPVSTIEEYLEVVST